MPTVHRPSIATTTVAPAKTTVRPAVATAVDDRVIDAICPRAGPGGSG